MDDVLSVLPSADLQVSHASPAQPPAHPQAAQPEAQPDGWLPVTAELPLLEMLGPDPHLVAGRYRVTRVLGHGRMADVYAAQDEVLCRAVAVKVFRPGPDPAAGREQFPAEVRTLAGLTHPNLVSLYDGGQNVSSPWCVMQLLDGGTLADLTQALPAQRMAEIGAQLADGLAYIHQQGIVHRDVKPSNVLLDGEGTAYLSDFGVAQMVDASHLSAPGGAPGGAAFLAPEQVLGEPVGPASDVYALGLVLLEAGTGRREYPGAPIESALARLARPPRVPQSLGAPLAGLLAGMTAVDPAERPSAATVAQRLRLILAGNPVTTTQPATAGPVDSPATARVRLLAPRTAPAGGRMARLTSLTSATSLRRGALGLLAAASVAVAVTVAAHTPSPPPSGPVSGPASVQPTSAPGPVVAADPGSAQQVQLPGAGTPSPLAPTNAGKGVAPVQLPRPRVVTNPRPVTAAGSTGSPSLVGKPTTSPSPSLSGPHTPSPSTSPSPVEPSPRSPSVSPKPSATGSPTPAPSPPASPSPNVTPSPVPTTV